MGMVVNLKRGEGEIFDRTRTVTTYYEEVRKFPILSKAEEDKLFETILFSHSDKEVQMAKAKIINSNQRFVIAIAKRYGSNDNFLDLVEEGNLGLMEALDKFDPTKDTKFTTWAVWFIRRAINNYSINYGSQIRKTNLSRTYHLVSQAKNAFFQSEGRYPNEEELAEILADKYDTKINDLSDLVDARVISIDDTYKNESNEDAVSIGDIGAFNDYSASYNDYEDKSDKDFAKTMVTSLLTKLSKREQDVMKMMYGVGYSRSYYLDEISNTLSLTRERVRQIANDALKKMKKEYANVLNSPNL